MSDLIARLEAASEGSRELDALVWVATLPPDGKGIDGYGLPDSGAHYEHEADEDGSVTMWVVWSIASRSKRARRPAPAYTTSLDAALSLVPEGWDYQLVAMWYGNATPTPRLLCTAVVRSPDARYEDVPEQGGPVAHLVAGVDGAGIQRPTMPLALCIAALRARAPAPGERE